MSSHELFISSPLCTCADASDYVIWLLCAQNRRQKVNRGLYAKGLDSMKG